MRISRNACLFLLLLVYEAEDVRFGEGASADGTNSSIGAPGIEAAKVEHVQAGSLPDRVVRLHSNEANGAYFLIYVQLAEPSPREIEIEVLQLFPNCILHQNLSL